MFTAVTMLLRYLSDSPVAPLQSRLVEVPEPFCSEISDSVYENFESCIGFTFSGVPTQQLGLLEDKYNIYIPTLTGPLLFYASAYNF